MCLMEDHFGFMINKQMMIILEDKSILVVDQVIQELNNRFDEVNMELLICMSCLNPINSFASYDAQKVMRLAQFYPNDISSVELIRLEFQLETFIEDMRKDDRFKCVNHLGELSTMLVETKKAYCL